VPGRSLTVALVEALKKKQMLLLLDNCEHLLDACAHFVDTLLASCPHLRILATSREYLGVAGEAVWVVSSLSVPRTDRLPDAGELTRYDAVRLFVDRARLRLPDFDLTSANGRVVAEVCTRLEGMPLAIELATARMGAVAVEEIAQRLEDSLKLLTAGPRTVEPRHRTMRATLEWSHGLLSEPERVLFRRLSVFAGGWTLEAAEAVCPGGAIEEGDILDLMSGLVDKSLMVAETFGEGRGRYRLLEPVRQYARERLEKMGEAEAVRHQHAAFYLDWAESAEAELRGPGQVEWLERLEDDNDNLRAAMAWLLEKGEVEAAVRMAWSLWQFWLIHGYQGEGRRWIEVALAKGENLAAHTRAKALCVQASTFYGLESPEQLKQTCQEAAALFRLVGDKRGLAYTLVGQAYALMQRGDAERAIALFKESYSLAREAGDKWAMCGGLVGMGSTYLGLGAYEQAARYLEEALALSREIGNKFSESSALYGLALAEHGQDDHKRATELYAEGLKSSAQAGDKANIAYCLEGLAHLAAAQGESEHAAQLFGAAEASLEDAGGALYAYAQDRSLRDQAVDALRSRLDETALAAAWAEGRAMTPDQAAEYALSEEELFPSVSPVLAQPSVGTQPIALTGREEEVTVLVSRGLTNRQIATELSISEHTVATHLGKIMRKLRLNSRSQLAAWVVERRTPP
jgi:predicted ATPase/DNA-binding CsgD family transcriptional regulator